ncbi:34819_t:CDS:2, partial [Racocetra persica]
IFYLEQLQSFNDVFFFNMLQPHDKNTKINEPYVEDDLSDTSDQDPYTKTQILKNQPHNADIIYDAPAMDKHLWKLISLQAKEIDKFLSKKYIETAFKDFRPLFLDTLFYTNELRREQSLKVISPNYTPPIEKKEQTVVRSNIIIKEIVSDPLMLKVQRRPQLWGSPKILQQPKLYDQLIEKLLPVRKRYQSEWFSPSSLNIILIKANNPTIPELLNEIQKLLEKQVIEE